MKLWGSVVLTMHTLYLQKLALTLLTSSGRSVGIVRLWTRAIKFVFVSVVG
jgi:hypothetical protein